MARYRVRNLQLTAQELLPLQDPETFFIFWIGILECTKNINIQGELKYLSRIRNIASYLISQEMMKNKFMANES